MAAHHSKETLIAMMEARNGDTYFANLNCKASSQQMKNQIEWVLKKIFHLQTVLHFGKSSLSTYAYEARSYSFSSEELKLAFFSSLNH